MKNRILFVWRDVLMVLSAFGLFFGCIATSHRSARTLDEDQVSVSASYLRAEDIDESESEPIHLAAIDGRLGLAKGIDIGVMHTWDFTRGNENAFATLWGDVKFQLTNRDNKPQTPTLSAGLKKGFIYDSDIKLHVTSVPFMLDYRLNESVTPFFFFRYELIRDSFIPDRVFESSRNIFGVGAEFLLGSRDPSRWQPKLGLTVGTFNSLTGGEGNRCLTFNVGLSIDSPVIR